MPDNLGTITDNTVTGGEFGIKGGELIRGNLVQSAFNGISGGTTVRHNTLINDSISMSSSGDVSDNLISTSPTYMQLPYSPLFGNRETAKSCQLSG